MLVHRKNLSALVIQDFSNNISFRSQVTVLMEISHPTIHTCELPEHQFKNTNMEDL